MDNGNLGSGEFGKVCMAKIFKESGKILPAAVKMPLTPATRGSLMGILSEIKVLSYTGKHENIVELLGAYTEQLPKGMFAQTKQNVNILKLLRQIFRIL